MLRECLTLNDDILERERECKQMEAEIEINRLSEDKKVYHKTLDKEIEIIECMRKRKILVKENLVNNYDELSATADALRFRISELTRQIKYLTERYSSIQLGPKVEYSVKQEINDRVVIKKVLKKIESTQTRSKEQGTFQFNF